MSTKVNIMSYLEGVYAPVTDEREVLNLEVLGELPAGLRGVFGQNNPNPFYAPRGPYHWFDGDGMVHGLEFEGGQAHYRNRYIMTEGLSVERDLGEGLWRGLLNPIDGSLPGGPDKNTANTDLIWHNGKLLATWWLGGVPYELDPKTLETIGPVTFDGRLRCGVSAHPKVDPRTGELVFFDYSPYGAPYLQYGVVSARGELVHHTVIDVPGPRLFHDIAITENFSVVFDFPMLWDPEKIAQGKRRVRFDRALPSRFGVLPRHGEGTEVRWFEADPCYMYHAVNAFERINARGEREVVVIGCRIDDPMPTCDHQTEPEIPRLYFLRMDPYPWEWTLNLDTGAVTQRQLDDRRSEFPRMNDAFLGEQARYAYHQSLAKEPTLLFDGVSKHDMETGHIEVHEHGRGWIAGETVFVADPERPSEDGGWLICFANTLDGQRSECRVIDAQHMSSEPIARIQLPRRVPFGFHADWVPMDATP